MLQHLTNRQHQRVDPGNEMLWTYFLSEFRRAFTDTSRADRAHEALLACHMKGEDLDGYIAEFEHLRSLAGWGENDKGTIDLFYKGLKKPLFNAIINTPGP